MTVGSISCISQFVPHNGGIHQRQRNVHRHKHTAALKSGFVVDHRQILHPRVKCSGGPVSGIEGNGTAEGQRLVAVKQGISHDPQQRITCPGQSQRTAHIGDIAGEDRIIDGHSHLRHFIFGSNINGSAVIIRIVAAKQRILDVDHIGCNC